MSEGRHDHDERYAQHVELGPIFEAQSAFNEAQLELNDQAAVEREALAVRIAALEAGAPPPDPDPDPTPTVYGAVDYGPDHAPYLSEGQIRDTVSGLPASGVVLLRAGTYGSFTIPAGVTVAPYQKEHVQVNGSAGFNNGSKLIGVHGNGGTNWFARPNRDSSSRLTGAVIDYCDLTGSGWEVVRASRNVELDISNSKIVGGRNHCVKYHGEGSAYKPGGKIVNSYLSNPEVEDGFQAEGAGAILLSRCTFDGAPENNIDLKTGTITTEFCDMVRSTQGNYLCHGNAVGILKDSKIGSPRRIELGSNNSGNASLTVIEQTLVDGQVWLKKSKEAIFRDCNFRNVVIDLGQNDRGAPVETIIDGGRFENVTIARKVAGAKLTLVNSPEIIGGSGW